MKVIATFDTYDQAWAFYCYHEHLTVEGAPVTVLPVDPSRWRVTMEVHDG